MRNFFERMFGGGQPEEPAPKEVPPITEKPKPYRDPNEMAWAKTGQVNTERTKRLETNPREEMRLKKGELGAMLRRLVPGQPWNETDISQAMSAAEVVKLPSINRGDKAALQEMADAIALRIRKQEMEEHEDQAAAAK